MPLELEQKKKYVWTFKQSFWVILWFASSLRSDNSRLYGAIGLRKAEEVQLRVDPFAHSVLPKFRKYVLTCATSNLLSCDLQLPHLIPAIIVINDWLRALAWSGSPSPGAFYLSGSPASIPHLVSRPMPMHRRAPPPQAHAGRMPHESLLYFPGGFFNEFVEVWWCDRLRFGATILLGGDYNIRLDKKGIRQQYKVYVQIQHYPNPGHWWWTNTENIFVSMGHCVQNPKI